MVESVVIQFRYNRDDQVTFEPAYVYLRLEYRGIDLCFSGQSTLSLFSPHTYLLVSPLVNRLDFDVVWEKPTVKPDAYFQQSKAYFFCAFWNQCIFKHQLGLNYYHQLFTEFQFLQRILLELEI